MRRWFWGTAVLLMMLLATAVGCAADADSTQLEPADPSFIFFYTDN